MKKLILVLSILILMMMGCTRNDDANQMVGQSIDTEQSLEEIMTGEWLLEERQMVIQFNTVQNDYIEYRDTFDLPTQVQARHIRYDKDSDFELEFEHANLTSFYIQTFGNDFSDVENYDQTENTYYSIEYRDHEVFYKLDEDKSNRQFVDQYEINGFTNAVEFKEGKLYLTLSLTAEDFVGDPGYEGVLSITGTMVLIPYME